MSVELAGLQTDAEHTAAQRSRVYQILGAAFAFPDEALFDAVRDGTLLAALADACANLPYDLRDALTSGLHTAPDTYADFESEYIRLFDVGAAGPPCPLYGGVYVGDRMKVMEDATRFYNFFHLHLSPQLRELPDHVTTQLEFLHYLTFREAESQQHGLDASSLLRAERDFLARHLCKWMPRLAARLAKQSTFPFFTALVGFALAFFEHDHAYTTAVAGN